MEQTPKEEREMTQSEARDKTAKIVAGMLPMGSAAYELITTIVVPLHEKKKREFLNDLADRLKKLEDEERIDYQVLAESEEFNTIITKAILLAQQNHQEEKIEALKNLVSNSAVKMSNQDAEVDLIEHYLYLIERFSNLHFLILKIFRDPSIITKGLRDDINSSKTTNLRMLFSRIHPELNTRLDFVQHIWKDLYNQGLVSKETMQNAVADGKVISSLLTDFGEGLMNFIEVNFDNKS